MKRVRTRKISAVARKGDTEVQNKNGSVAEILRVRPLDFLPVLDISSRRRAASGYYFAVAISSH